MCYDICIFVYAHIIYLHIHICRYVYICIFLIYKVGDGNACLPQVIFIECLLYCRHYSRLQGFSSLQSRQKSPVLVELTLQPVSGRAPAPSRVAGRRGGGRGSLLIDQRWNHNLGGTAAGWRLLWWPAWGTGTPRVRFLP